MLLLLLLLLLVLLLVVAVGVVVVVVAAGVGVGVGAAAAAVVVVVVVVVSFRSMVVRDFEEGLPTGMKTDPVSGSPGEQRVSQTLGLGPGHVMKTNCHRVILYTRTQLHRSPTAT